jgi:nucleoid-associated protein YgaU
MAIYDFPAGGGSLPRPDQVIAELRRHGLPTANLRAEAVSEAIRLTGTVPDPEAHERVLVAVGNMPGVERVDDRLGHAHGASLFGAIGGFAHLPPGAAATDMDEDMVHEADPARVHADPLGPAGSSFHTVMEGETLDSIAQRHYGDRNAILRILEANRPMLSGAAALRPGLVLRVPRR